MARSTTGLRVSDNWGRLAVDDGGALITNDLSTLRISARNVMTERNHISGDGWNLVLNDGWQAAGDGKGGYTVSKKKIIKVCFSQWAEFSLPSFTRHSGVPGFP